MPISSKKPKEYIKLEQDHNDKKITLEECEEKKSKITEVIQIDNIYRFKNMTRWANITRMKKVSILRLNFNGSTLLPKTNIVIVITCKSFTSSNPFM